MKPAATDPSAAAAAAAASSNVRETFTLMSSLIYPRIPVRYLELCARILQRRHLDTVFEERAVQSLCALPSCGNKLTAKTGKYRVSLARKEIYDAQYENKFCSQQCLQVRSSPPPLALLYTSASVRAVIRLLTPCATVYKARVFLATLVAKPPQLVPSVLEVFGTEHPNPFDFDDPVAPSHHQPQPSSSSSLREHTTSRPPPQATTVWAKTADLGVVERTSAPVSATSLSLRENSAPAAPDTAFPDASHAVLIEGFVFPSHKHKLAKKVEKLLVQSDDDAQDGELVVSDSDESGDSDAASDASSASFALSDFDEDEEITLDALSLFGNLWRLLSSWVTHETALVVAGRPLPAPEAPVADDAEARAARYRMAERRNAFALMVGRPIPQAAQRLGLSADRSVHQKLSDITSTFALRDAVDARNSHQARHESTVLGDVECRMSDWTCVAAVLLLVVHGKRREDVESGQLDHVMTYTKLEGAELAQLLELFYALRNDGDVVVDTDTAPLEEISTDSANAGARNGSQTSKIRKCRKCLRATDKCVCAARAATGRQPDFSVGEVEAMMQEALTLRDEYEELLDA
ncbi:hypothetical protein PybrP1_007628 [[Pythium] brassicae (nom. inval.)]|nr:hypothetical protein PybrP1_007628 [[Pythium] brassicae (nom. inval.)]